MTELIKASSYCGNRAPGWVALINGQPRHCSTKREAAEVIKQWETRHVAQP
jgi:hypothetical protein